MKTLQTYTDLSKTDQGAVIALGNFDGLHRGHQAVIARAQAIADDLRKTSGVPIPGDKNAQAQADQMQQQQMQQKLQQEQAGAAAAIDVNVANAERHRAAARQANANAALIEQRIQAGIAPAEVHEKLARAESFLDAANEDQLINESLQEAAA